MLQELAQTPLMLSIMSLACQGADGNELARQKGNSPEERRKQIFRLYVEQMFQRKGMTSLVFPKEKIIGWLSWLAGKMREHSQSVFLVEGLQPSWLGTRRTGRYGTVVALGIGLIFGLSVGLSVGRTRRADLRAERWAERRAECGLAIFVGIGLGCWSESPLKNGAMSGSIGGLIYALSVGLRYGMRYAPDRIEYGLISGLIGGLGVGSLNHITLVETISWKWNQFWKRTIPGSIFGLIFGLIAGLSRWADLGADVGLSYGLIVGLIGGLVSGLIGGFTDRVKVGKASPNQGIKLSRKNSLAVFLVTWLIIGLIVGLSYVLVMGLLRRLLARNGLSYGLIVGLILGLIVGLNRGGSAVIKHYALRLILWLKGYTPLNFIKFLDQLRQADSPEESGRWLHLHPPDAARLLCRSASSGCLEQSRFR